MFDGEGRLTGRREGPLEDGAQIDVAPIFVFPGGEAEMVKSRRRRLLQIAQPSVFSFWRRKLRNGFAKGSCHRHKLRPDILEQFISPLFEFQGEFFGTGFHDSTVVHDVHDVRNDVVE